jgi:hypothetical protein
MKSLFASLSLLLAALLSVSCASSPGLSDQTIVGHWISTSRWDAGSLPQQQLGTTTAILNLRKDGTYEASLATKSAKSKVEFKVYSHTGTWTTKGTSLILHPTKVEGGIVPKKLPVIKYQVTEITKDTLSLKLGQRLTTYTKNR